jgi:hypothetical protein
VNPAMELLKRLDNELKTIFGKPPAVVYHYTGSAGLIGLIEKGKVWVTKVEYLNDPVEEAYGRKIVASVAMEEAEKEPDAQIAKFLISVAKHISEGSLGYATNYYLASFSASSDDLTQWRAYGKDGWGYAVGMRVGKNGIGNEHIVPVIYSERDQRELTRRCLLLAVRTIREEGTTPAALEKAYAELSSVLLELIICMKQEAYAHEKEWRIVFERKQEKVHFREGRNHTVIPYIPIKLIGGKGELSKIPIEKILLGPQREDDRESIRLLLAVNGYPDTVTIQKSKIRYRA